MFPAKDRAHSRLYWSPLPFSLEMVPCVGAVLIECCVLIVCCVACVEGGNQLTPWGHKNRPQTLNPEQA